MASGEVKRSQAVARVGSRAGRLVLTEWLGSNEHRRALYRCVCDCGVEVVKCSADVRKSPSCGCAGREIQRRTHLTHGGASRRGEHSLYGVWRGMRARCNNPRHKDFRYYGAKGVKVCTRWDDFATFVADMGPRPSPSHEVDRVRAVEGYEPSNCRWLEKVENARRAQVEHWAARKAVAA